MTTYIVRRLLQMVLVLVLVTLIVFFVMRLTPGDPIYLYIARSGNVQNMSFSQIQSLRHEFGLDQPLIFQYFSWVGNVFHGDLGKSIIYHRDINGLFLEKFPVTLVLGTMALIVSSVLGVLAGIIAAVWRGRWADKIVTPLSYIGLTIPVFWLGYLLIYAFGYYWPLFPIAGYHLPWNDFGLSIKESILPVICMSVFGIAGNARQMRSSMLEVIRQDYIRTAWAKGLNKRLVIIKHALKNSVIPVITLIGFGVGIILGGDVLVETVFQINGIGFFLTQSIINKDYVVIQSVTLVISIIILLVNLLVDISYAWLDPRIRYG